MTQVTLSAALPPYGLAVNNTKETENVQGSRNRAQASRLGHALDHRGHAANHSRSPQGLKFRHRLGRVPTIVQVQFSADESFDDVYVVQWPYAGEHNHGPVSMRADTRNVYLEFTDGPIFGAWTHNPPAWQNFNEGYFRVIAF